MSTSSLVTLENFSRDDIKVIPVAMNDIAMELGDPRMVNMVALGAYIEKSGVVSVASLEEGLREVLPERNHRFIPANIKAIAAGALAAKLV